MPTPTETLIPAWLRYHREGGESDFWAWEEVETRIDAPDGLEDGWLLITALIEMALPEDLEHIAAGPLESFVRGHHAAAIARVVQRAAADATFRDCLGRIWLDEDELLPEDMARLVWASEGRIKPSEKPDA